MGAKRFFLFLCAVLLGVANTLVSLQNHSDSVRPLRPSSLEGSLTCEEIYRIGVWGVSHYGGTKRANIRSGAFSDRLLTKFVEKLDPYKVLFTAAEVEAFKSRGREAWGRLLNSQHCEYFETWVRASFPAVKARFEAGLKEIPLDTKSARFGERASDAGAPEAQVRKFHRFAKDEAELRGRLEQIAARILSGTPRRLLEAYGNDKRLLVSETLHQLLFDHAPVARHLIAKAWLGAVDPYSTYFSPGEFDDFYSDLAGGMSGIGVRVRLVPRGLLIEKVLKGSAADRSKLEEGDLILAVDGVKVAPLPSKAAKRLLSGPEGTTVTVAIERHGKQGPTVKIRRETFAFEEAKIKLKLVTPASDRSKRIAVIDVPSFYGRGGMGSAPKERSSAEDLERVMDELITKPGKRPDALVLDLRGNPGGYLEEAVSMAGLFLGDRPVVGVVEGPKRRVLRDSRKKALYGGPLVMLVDEASASAAEILAGALRDNQRAVLVGSPHTYGKGSIQKLFHLDDAMFLMGVGGRMGSGVVKLTTSIFYSPLGHSPANGGVKTHIVLPTAPVGEDSVAEGTSAGRVPEESPFFDERAIERARSRERNFHEKVSLLSAKSRRRLGAVSSLSSSKDEPVLEKKTLDETVAIASDWATLWSQAVGHSSLPVRTAMRTLPGGAKSPLVTK